MAVKTAADLKSDMPIGTAGGITASEIHNIVDSAEEWSTQRVLTKSASYTAAAGTDNRTFFVMDVAGGNTFTVPADAPAGWECAVFQLGAGQTAIAAAGSGTLRHSDGHAKISKQYGMVYLKVYANAGGAPQVAFTGDTTL